MTRLEPVQIVTTADAVAWAGTKYRLAQILEISRQAVFLWGEYPPKRQQWVLDSFMRQNPDTSDFVLVRLDSGDNVLRPPGGWGQLHAGAAK